MSASNTDKLRKGYFGTSTTLSASIGNTDTTIPFSSTTGWPTDTAIDVTIDRVDANGNKTPANRETITVVISSLNGINAVRGVEGSALAHSAGAVVEITFTAATHNDSIDWALVDHNQQGHHKSLTDTNGNTWIGQIATPSAVNYPNFANAAMGNSPKFSVAGSDTNIGADWSGLKGTGQHTGIVEKLKNSYKFSVYRNASWTVSNASATKVPYDTATFDTGSNFDLTTNHRFTAPVAGFYQFSASFTASISAASGVYVMLYKNGAEVKRGAPMISGAGTYYDGSIVSGLLELAAGDYVEVYAFQTGAASAGGVGANNTWFDCFLVSTT